MVRLRDFHRANGAQVADDGIPLQYGPLDAEFSAACDAAVLLDRSHEGRVVLAGTDRFEFVQRMTTNDLRGMSPGEGRQTIFTTPTARIFERVTAYNRESLLLVAGPGRGDALRTFLQRNIFFRDQVTLTDSGPGTVQFALHGPHADRVADAVQPGAAALKPLHGVETSVDGVPAFLARRKPYTGAHWLILTALEHGPQVWQALLAAGADHGLMPAGSLTYNALRIRSGVPGVGREVSEDFIPLEVGLWDEVSFSKGCYTGQEIIARMESRGKLAKTLVRLALDAPVNAPAALMADGKAAGTLTSSVLAPDGRIYALGVLRTALAVPGQALTVGEQGVGARVVDLPGAQPPVLTGED
jgi:aminomethyltransferase